MTAVAVNDRPVRRRVVLTIPGEAKAKGRPKFNSQTKRAYTPAATERAENRVILEWMAAGRPMLEVGPLAAEIEIVLARPQDHWRTNGTLTPKGQRCTRPTTKPDLDNAVKLIWDALNGLVYADDSSIVYISASKRYQHNADEAPHTIATFWSVG